MGHWPAYEEYVMRTISAKESDIERTWWLVDAEGLVLGRMATVVANRLRGKHKPIFTPHVDCGDHVVIVNAEKVAMTGKKLSDKRYYWHTGYPGGIKERSPEQLREAGHPERIVMKAIERMVPKGPLGRQQLRKLRVYAGGEHPHEAQKLQPLDLAAMNPKNKRSA